MPLLSALMPMPRAGTAPWASCAAPFPPCLANLLTRLRQTVNAVGSAIGFAGAIPCCICCPNPFKNVHQGNVGLVTKFGKFYKAVDPGLVKVNPLSERLIQVDV